MYKQLFLILLILMAMTTGITFASKSTSTTDIDGAYGSSILMSSKSSSEITSNGLGASSGSYNIQTNARRVMALNGLAILSAKDVSNQQFYNMLDTSTNVESSAASLVDVKTSMENYKDINSLYANLDDAGTPSYQFAESEFIQNGVNGAKHESVSVVDDANITSSMRAEGNAGSATAIKRGTVLAGLDAGEDTMHYGYSEYVSASVYGSNGTKYNLPVDFTWEDYSVPMEIINNTSEENATMNETVDISNVTFGKEEVGMEESNVTNESDESDENITQSE
ncbi:MAG: hypothetical protein WC877_01385 [Dehalococcoidales bacterium]|jgi:hypothetical protein